MKLRSILASLAVCWFAAEPAGAQSSDLDELLGQTIVSTPSSSLETDTTAPATSSVITADELRRYGIRTLDEAINFLSLGMATSTPSHTAEIGSRGVLFNGDYGNHVLLLVDGHTLNEPWNGTAYFDRGLGVPFEMIDSIEVILGPGSVLYGSQAMLGVINVVTKRAKNFRGARLVAEADAALPPGKSGAPSASAGDTLGAGYRVGAGYGREFTLGDHASELTFGLDYYANRGPGWQLGPQPYGDDFVTLEPKNFGPRTPPGVWGGTLRDADYVQVPAAYLRFGAGDFQASLRASAYRRSIAFADSLASSAADFDDSENRELDRFLNLDLSQRLALSSRIELVLRGYGDLYDYDWLNGSSAAEDCPDGFIQGCDRKLAGTGRTLGGEIKTQIQWPILRASTLLGIDAKLRQVEDRLTIDDRLGAGELPAIGDSRTDGLLAPYVAQIFSPARWLDLNLGLRLDHDTRFGNELSPRAAAGVTPWNGGRLKLIYAEAFRSPSAYELTYADPNSQLPAPTLGPETVRSIEGSFEQRFGKHRLLLGVFRSWWSGLVSGTTLSEEELAQAIDDGLIVPGVEDAYRNANAASVENYGMNAGYEGAAVGGHLRFGVNYTAAVTRSDAGDGSGSLPLPVAPQTFGNLRISYDLGASLPTVALAARFADRRLADRTDDGGFSELPSAPPVFALRVAFTGQVPSLPNLRYRVAGDYSFHDTEPYVIGATLYAADETTRAELAPTRRAQGFIGLEYAFEATPASY